jgi:hypothetical protein
MWSCGHDVIMVTAGSVANGHLQYTMSGSTFITLNFFIFHFKIKVYKKSNFIIISLFEGLMGKKVI